MSGVKLVNKKTNELVDFDPSAVSQAIDSGEFAFDKKRNYPVIDNGEPKFIKWDDAAKYRDRVEFTTPDEVKNYRAEQRMSGVLPKLGAAAYGFGTGLTLGALPYAVSTLGGEAGRQYAEDVERGAPKTMLAGEVVGSLVDPFAIGAKTLSLGAKGVRAAQEVGRVAPALGREALAGIETAGARQVESVAAQRATQRGVAEGQAATGFGGQRVMAEEVSPLTLGRQAAAPTAEEAARLQFQARSRRGLLTREPLPEQPMFPVAPGEVATAEPGLRLGADVYRTPELAMRARQAEELGARAAGARAAEARAAENAAAMERGLAPGQVGPIEDFGQMPSSAMESDYVRSELSRIDDALDANAAAARRARTPASRDRIGAERERLLADRERLDVAAMRTGIRAEEDVAAQAGRAYEATQMQAAAPARALEAERMGRMAADIEAANVAPPVLGRAASRVEAATAEGARPLGEAGLGQRTMAPEPPTGLGLPTRTLSAEELAGIRLPETTAAAAPAPSALPAIGKGMLENAVYGTLRTRGSQEAGTEEGGWGEALGVGALGALGVPALMGANKLLGVAGGAAAKAAGAAAPTLGGKLSSALEKGAEKLESASALRSFGITSGQAGRIQRSFYNPEVEHLGTKEMTDFIRRELASVDALKALPENANNVNLQSIDAAGGLRKMTEEQRLAFTHAVNDALDKSRNAIYDQVGNPRIDETAIQSLISHGVPQRGTAGSGLEQIKPFVRELETGIREGFSLRELQRMKTSFGQALEQAHANTPWNKEETAFYNALKDTIHEQVHAASPELLDQLNAIDRGSQMAIELRKGAQKLAASHSTTQILGPDLLAQIGLGAFAMGRPFSAVSFGMGAVALRAMNLHRGDGIISDLAGSFSKRMATNPQAAAQQASQSILKAKTPKMTGLAAAQFVQTDPQGYSQMSSLVRQLGQERERVKADMMAELSSLPPEQQQKYADYFDAQVSALQSAQPKGLPTSEALTEQQRNFVIFGRSVLDPTYGMQVILNGGPEADQAAKALRSTPQGQQTLDALQAQLAAAMNENTKFRQDKAILNIVQNVKRVSKRGSISLATLHSPQGEQQSQGGATPSVNASGQKRAANAFSGTVE